MNSHPGWRSILGVVTWPTALIAGLWLLFNAISEALPYVRPGAEVIYNAKTLLIRGDPLFRRDAAIKLIVFGDSKVLSAFQPDLFDAPSRGVISSYNLGLPGDLHFLEILESLCQRGERPTHVLLMYPWSDEPEKQRNVFRMGIEDSRVMDELFPFRKMPRNLMLFAVRSQSRGGVFAHYEESRRQAVSMLDKKGYYFIEGQSHYPNHRLPEDFRLQKDDSTRPFLRHAKTNVPAFKRLEVLVERFNIRVIFVPVYHREGEFAQPGQRSAMEAALVTHPQFSVRGPDYWLLPNRYFSDPVHLNESGAEHYTRRLWELIGSELVESVTSPNVQASSAAPG